MTDPQAATSDPQGTTIDTETSVSSSVEVALDPATAFSVFTEELDLWWSRGPINYYAAGRAVAMRCEPGLGGRLLEVYDDAAGDYRELGRITAWDPPARLAWTSSVDDVATEVRFEAAASGTCVTVTARVPAGGSDRGGSAWVRVVPRWYGDWCSRRDEVPHEIRDIAPLALAVNYKAPIAAARWLSDVFGFEPPHGLPDESVGEEEAEHVWIEFRLGDSSLMLFKAAGAPSSGAPTHAPWVYVADVEVHFDRSRSRGVKIVQELSSPWGLPFYTAADLEGHHWTFAQARPTMRLTL